MKAILKLLFSFLSISALNKIVPILTIPILTDKLGFEKYGIYVFVLALVGFIETIINLGFKVTAVNQLSRLKSAKEENELFLNVFYAKILISTLIFTMMGILYFFPINENFIYVWMCSPLILGFTINQDWFFHAKKDMLAVTSITFLNRIIYLISIFLFVENSSDLNLVLLLFSFGFFFQSLITSGLLIKKYKIKLYLYFGFRSVFIEIKNGFYFFLASLSSYFYSNFNYIILGSHYNLNIVGLYAIVDKVCNGLRELAVPLNNSIFPFLSEKRENDRKLYERWSLKYIVFLFFFFSFISVVVLISNQYIMEFFNVENSDTPMVTKLFYILPLGIPIHVLSSFLGFKYVIDKNDKKLFQITFIGSIISVCVLWATSLYFSIYSFALIYVCVLLLLFALLFFNIPDLKFFKNETT